MDEIMMELELLSGAGSIMPYLVSVVSVVDKELNVPDFPLPYHCLHQFDRD